MSKYEVVRPWFGVSKGDVVELKELHPSLVSHVRKLSDKAAELAPATPDAPSGDRKGDIAKRLKELGIDFNGRLGADKLAELLPDGDPLKTVNE